MFQNYKANLLLFIILSTLASCVSYQEARVNKLFSQWEEESRQLAANNKENEKKEIQNIVEQVIKHKMCMSLDSLPLYPKLKYSIIRNQVNVSVIRNDIAQIQQAKDTVIRIYPECSENHSILLYVTPKYRKYTFGKLRYGFGNDQEGKNRNNARIILHRHHTSKNYRIPIEIEKIEIDYVSDYVSLYYQTIYADYYSLYQIRNNQIYHLSTVKTGIE